MSILDFDDTYVPPFTPHRYEKDIKDSFEELQDLGHKEMSEDYSDEINKLSW